MDPRVTSMAGNEVQLQYLNAAAVAAGVLKYLVLTIILFIM